MCLRIALQAMSGVLFLLIICVPASAQRAPAWTRGATCYEVFVRSFFDSDGDGIGDLNGLTSKLDYINDGNAHSTRSLGARCIWLMPIDASPSYHGYDVSDYYRVARDYGTNKDFARLMTAAHARGIKVIVDLVLNHSSSEHPHFQEALRDTASPYRAWYRWSYVPLDKGPWGPEVWHKSPVRNEYYYGLFSSHMPDLNYETPAVVDEAKRVARFWLDSMHVDGFRLDAVSYLVEHGAQLAHTKETHALLRDWQAAVRAARPDVYTIGEVTYPNDTLMSYYPDQLTSYFAFEVADSLIASVRSGSARGMLAPVVRLARDAPSGGWSPFLRNHDQPRTVTELGGSMAKAKLAVTILLTLPGMPYVYYGEELGMVGGKPDERIRTPMQWSAAHGDGFTTGAPWEQLASDSLTATVAAEERDPRSLLKLTRALIHLRDRCASLSGDTIVPLEATDGRVAAYLRGGGDHAVLVIANLSDSALGRVAVTSPPAALAVGGWTARELIGGRERVAPVVVSPDGRLHAAIVLPLLGATRAHLIELSHTGKWSCS